MGVVVSVGAGVGVPPSRPQELYSGGSNIYSHMSKRSNARLFAQDLARWTAEKRRGRLSGPRRGWVEQADDDHLRMTAIAGGSL
jgi:hypothetical protein